MEIKKGKLQYEGKTKKVYPTNDPGHLILHFKDDIPGAKKNQPASAKGKGNANAAVSAFVFQYLESYHIKTHFIGPLKPGELLVAPCDMMPVTVSVWNMAVADLRSRFGLEKGAMLEYPIIEYNLKDEKLKFPMITPDHACAFGYANPDEMQYIDKTSRKINAVLKSFFDRRGMKLAGFQVEFGRVEDMIVLADEVSLDTCLLFDSTQMEAGDFRHFLTESDTPETLYGDLKDRICE